MFDLRSAESGAGAFDPLSGVCCRSRDIAAQLWRKTIVFHMFH